MTAQLAELIVTNLLWQVGQIHAGGPKQIGAVFVEGVARRRLLAAVGEVAARDAVQVGAECAVQRRLRALPRWLVINVIIIHN